MMRYVEGGRHVDDIVRKTRDIDPMLFQRCASLVDSDPAFIQHWVNVSCLLGSHSLLNYKSTSQST